MSFTLDLKRFTEKEGEARDDIVSGIEIELFNSVIRDTPVDTGRLRGNWFPSVGAEGNETSEDIDPTGQQAQQRSTAFVSGLSGGRLTYLTNNLPYAVPIEFGHSAVKAPAGMVRKNVARMQTIVDEQVTKNKL
jgi:hypothetical protein